MKPRYFALVLATVLFTAGTRLAAQEDSKASLGVATRLMKAEWLYSRNGGASFTKEPPQGAPPNGREGIVPLAFRGVFQVEDVAKIPGLWIRIAEPGDAPRASICDGDLKAASGGYWKDLGFCPTLLNARVSLNGKRITLTNGPMLYIWLPIAGELKRGENTIELAGDCYTYWGGAAAPSITASLLVAEPQPAAICNGPLLGDFGSGYFTLACRTRLPAELVVEVTPIDPPGKSIRMESSIKIWHRVKVPIPVGTRAVRYIVKSRVGAHESASGPYTVRFAAEKFRFVALGNVQAHRIAVDHWAATARHVSKLDPSFILHTGNCSEHGSWEFEWKRRYFDPAGALLASVPTLLTPCSRDFAGAVQELHYTPAADTYAHNWSRVVGPIRLIGLDGNQNWKAGEANYVWLEKELAAAREKFVFVLDAYPGYSSGKHSNKLYAALVQTRDIILPLLGKYNATALISGWDPSYERCEPTPDKGCTQIVTGAAGKNAYPFSPTATRLNPFSKGKGRDWAGWAGHGARSFCVFDVTADTVEFRAVAVPAEANGELRVLDKKTFRPR